MERRISLNWDWLFLAWQRSIPQNCLTPRWNSSIFHEIFFKFRAAFRIHGKHISSPEFRLFLNMLGFKEFNLAVSLEMNKISFIRDISPLKQPYNRTLPLLPGDLTSNVWENAIEVSLDTLSRKTVWEIPTILKSPIRFTFFPEALVERCMRSGSKKDDVVLDPFFGSGTVGFVARRLKRRYVGIEMDPKTANDAARRIRETGWEVLGWLGCWFNSWSAR